MGIPIALCKISGLRSVFLMYFINNLTFYVIWVTEILLFQLKYNENINGTFNEMPTESYFVLYVLFANLITSSNSFYSWPMDFLKLNKDICLQIVCMFEYLNFPMKIVWMNLLFFSELILVLECLGIYFRI